MEINFKESLEVPKYFNPKWNQIQFMKLNRLGMTRRATYIGIPNYKKK